MKLQDLPSALMNQHDIRFNNNLHAELPPWAVTMIERYLHRIYLDENPHLLFYCKTTGKYFTVFSPEVEFSVSRNGEVQYTWKEFSEISCTQVHTLELINHKSLLKNERYVRF